MYRQTSVTRRAGKAPKVCLEFGNTITYVYVEDWTGPQCRFGDRGSCDLCGASVDGEPHLYTRYDISEGDIEFAVCEKCTKAAFKALHVSQWRLTNGTL